MKQLREAQDNSTRPESDNASSCLHPLSKSLLPPCLSVAAIIACIVAVAIYFLGLRVGNTEVVKISVIMALFVFVVTATLLLFFARRWLQRRILAPIAMLKASTDSVTKQAENQASVAKVASLLLFDLQLRHTGDEIEALSLSVRRMCEELHCYTANLVTASQQRTSLLSLLKKAGQQRISMLSLLRKMDLLAYRDALTGAGNKAAYDKVVPRLEWQMRSGIARYAIILADLNYLKRINDTYGHEKGNYYIKKMHAVLAAAFTESPIFRIGGDEFVIVAEGHDYDEATAIIAALKITMKNMEADTSLQPWEKVSTAIGIAVYMPGKHASVEKVFKLADQAMYEDKRAMRACR
ncbi:MAG: GGDEF domain-containing protein [Desulfovibrio sp.]|nr:GGDEF domain-containing protein [Desulfovibrio sp.]